MNNTQTQNEIEELKNDINKKKTELYKIKKYMNEINRDIKLKTEQIEKICNHQRIKDSYSIYETEWVCKFCGF